MRRLILCLILMCLALSPAAAQDTPTSVPVLVPEVINTYPHDPAAFTQGLLFYDGKLYESTGLRGVSSLREVEIETGEVLRNLPITRSSDELNAPTPVPDYFAEGLERVGDQLIQLTWTEGEAFVYKLDTFERVNTFNYEGEGWGICNDGRYLFVSDGTNYLSLRDATTFDLIVKFLVTYENTPLQNNLLNELECVGDTIYANLWQTNFIVQIDKFTGNITGLIDTTDMLTEEERAALSGNQVLNGIAYNPDSDTFYITGKQWSKLYEVRFVPQKQDS